MNYPHSLSEWLVLATTVSTVASVICNLLPNAKYLDGYPRTQKAYNAVINIIAALAVNIRHCLPSLDVAAPVLGITKPIATGAVLPPK